MIYYFSGTGNSKWVAERLAQLLGERLIEIADAMARGEFRYTLSPGERIGWVFPTYSWGPAPIVLDFISKWHIDGYKKSDYCYMVTTCGDDVGQSVELWQKQLGFIEGKAAFSVQMPNNYILLPGFDVDDKMLERQKQVAARERVEVVAQNIAERRCKIDVVTGGWAWAKTRLVYPLFRKFYMSDKGFTATSACTHCGLCEKVCPKHNITLTADGVPQWNGDCAMCLSCIHRCPAQAIQYGKQTQKKGRYYFKDKQ